MRLGFGIAGYLTFEHYTSSTSLTCPAGGGAVNCLKVTTSIYSMIHGVPVALLGLVFFAVMGVLQSPPAWRSHRSEIRAARVVWSLIGVGTALWLVYAELFKIDAICLWCTSVHVLTLLVFITTVFGTVSTVAGLARSRPALTAPPHGTRPSRLVLQSTSRDRERNFREPSPGLARLPVVNCDTAREAISASIDGEPPGVDAAALEQHLNGCRACQAWREHAHELTRTVRLQPARSAPGPSDRLLALAADQSHLRWWPGSPTVARLGLVVVAAAQLAICVPVLLFGHDRSAPVHVAHEMGSFEVAVAIGFLVAARRPGRAMGMLSLMGAAAALLVLTAALDLVAGRTGLSDEAPHLLVVAGWLLLRWLASVAPPTWERPRSALAAIDAGRVAWTERRVRPRTDSVRPTGPEPARGTVLSGLGATGEAGG